MKQIFILAFTIFAMLISHAQPSDGNFFVQKQNKSATYAVGNFLIDVTVKNGKQPQKSVANKAEPQRLLWKTVPGVALVGAAVGKDSIRMHGIPEGSFTIIDTIIQKYDQQSITKITQDADRLVISGMLSGKGSNVNYSLCFKPISTKQLQYILTTAGSGSKDVNRLFLRYASPRDEHFYGFGEQLTYFNQKGNIIPILVQEHGIGRGLPILTQLVDWKFNGGGGNPYVTGMPAPQYITSKLNALLSFFQSFRFYPKPGAKHFVLAWRPDADLGSI